MLEEYNVSFVCNSMVIQTRVSLDPASINDEYGIDEDEIARIASQNILDNHGIDPLDLCQDYEIHEVQK